MANDYYDKIVPVKMTEKQRMMFGIMADILDEKRSTIVRRLLIAEAKRLAAELEGEELELWCDLINQIEKAEDYHRFKVGEAISEGRKAAYKERTGIEMSIYRERKMDELKDKQREWQRQHRLKIKMQQLRELEEKYGEAF